MKERRAAERERRASGGPECVFIHLNSSYTRGDWEEWFYYLVDEGRVAA
jgi:hypothetical protein